VPAPVLTMIQLPLNDPTTEELRVGFEVVSVC
jgi:hypothetical protein